MDEEAEKKRRRQNQRIVMDTFKRRKAVDEVHCRLSSGRHALLYIRKNRVIAYHKDVFLFGKMIAEEFFCYAEHKPEVVIGPGANGVAIAQGVVSHLGEMLFQETPGIYADKTIEGFCIRKDYREFIKDKNVLIVDDILTTGGSIKKLIKAVREAGGIVMGIAVICDRGGVKKIEGIPVFALSKMRIPDYPDNEKDCPGCRNKIPINTDVGHPPTK